MISSDTPPKLREIIMNTWPQLFWLKKQKETPNEPPKDIQSDMR